jgi:hypothetical protein
MPVEDEDEGVCVGVGTLLLVTYKADWDGVAASVLLAGADV